MHVAVYAVRGGRRATKIAQAFYEGLRRSGVSASILSHFDGKVRGDVAVAYGWIHEPIFSAYRAAGAAYAYWDLGYWNRSATGHHRLAVNSWDTADNMLRGCGSTRFARLGIEVSEPLDRGDGILVAGMSDKAAGTHGFAPGQWEAETCLKLQEMELPYPIRVRSKPNRDNPPATSAEEDLLRARLLVTHHSNIAIDALVAGIPCYATKGAGRLASPRTLDRAGIERPYRPTAEERFRILFDIAYAQWDLQEMRTGEAWYYVKRIVEQCESRS